MATIENRPAAYFPSMTTEELIEYATIYGCTALERELRLRLIKTKDDLDHVTEESVKVYQQRR